MSMRLRSDAFEDGDVLPERYVRGAGNVAPPLDWDGVPAGAAELVLLCEDLDAAGDDGRPFLHWLVSGIEADLDGIGEGEDLDRTRTGRNGFGGTGYDGPEPPPGEEHRYVFTLVAVSGPVDPDGGDARDELPARELGRATLACRRSAPQH
jgi:Raf kinase inhibitor-like YbhB/YbcL family protein